MRARMFPVGFWIVDRINGNMIPYGETALRTGMPSAVQRLAIKIAKRTRKMPRSGIAVTNLGTDRSLHTMMISPSVTRMI